MIPLFEYDQSFDGHSLFILYEQSQSNMESTYQLLNSQINQIHERNLPFLTFIQFISHIRKQSNPFQIRLFIRYILWYISTRISRYFSD